MDQNFGSWSWPDERHVGLAMTIHDPIVPMATTAERSLSFATYSTLPSSANLFDYFEPWT